jgi:hypothetical protein
MIRALSILKETVDFLPGFQRAVQGLVSSLPELILKGGIEIETFIPYLPEDFKQNNKHSFRTLIQIDGDVITHVPHPELFPGDTRWAEHYVNTWSNHKREVRRKLSQFKGLYSIPWILSSVFSIPIIVFSHMKYLFSERPMSWLIGMLVYGAAVCLIRYPARYILRLTFLSLFGGRLGRYFRRYLAQRQGQCP